MASSRVRGDPSYHVIDVERVKAFETDAQRIHLNIVFELTIWLVQIDATVFLHQNVVFLQLKEVLRVLVDALHA